MNSVRRDAPMRGAPGISGKPAATASAGKRGVISNIMVANETGNPAASACSGGAISSTTEATGTGKQAAVSGSGVAISSNTGGGIAGHGPAAGGCVVFNEIKKEAMAESTRLANSYNRIVQNEFLAEVDAEEAEIIAKNLENAKVLRENAKVRREKSGAAAVAKKQQ